MIRLEIEIHENVVAVLPIDYSEAVQPYRDRVEGRVLPIASSGN